MDKVPSLCHGDTVVTEPAAICAHLVDAFPAARLLVWLNRRRSTARPALSLAVVTVFCGGSSKEAGGEAEVAELYANIGQDSGAGFFITEVQAMTGPSVWR